MAKPYGSQGFLNPPYSHNSGSFKFSVRPRKEDRGSVGRSFTTMFRIADCQEHIELDFGVGTVYTSSDVDTVKSVIENIDAAEAKIDLFCEEVIKFRKAFKGHSKEYRKALQDHLAVKS